MSIFNTYGSRNIMPKTGMILLLLCSYGLFGQDTNVWHVLADVTFKTEKNAKGFTVDVPVFGAKLRSFSGKKIKLKGYIIPLAEVNGTGPVMLSSLPFSMCYFCSAAGPETVIELEPVNRINFSSAQIIVEGILNLNERNPEHHIFILKKARQID